MESISSIQQSFPAKASESLAGRAIASFGSEINQLITMTEDAVLPSGTLGSKVDVKA